MKSFVALAGQIGGGPAKKPASGKKRKKAMKSKSASKAAGGVKYAVSKNAGPKAGPGRRVKKGGRGEAMKKYGMISRVTKKKKWKPGYAEGVMVGGKFKRNALAKNGGEKVLWSTKSGKVVARWKANSYKGAKGGRHRYVSAKEHVRTSKEKMAASKAVRGKSSGAIGGSTSSGKPVAAKKPAASGKGRSRASI